MHLRIVLATLVLALAGCAGSSKVMVGQARPPWPASSSVVPV